MPNFAFLTLGRLQVFRDGRVVEVTSRFGDRLRERVLEIERQQAWKSQGAGARFMGMWAMRRQTSAEDMPISITSLAPGANAGEMVYTLETPDICGLLQLDAFGADEQRLWHSNQTRIRDLTRHPTKPRIACAVWESNGTANIGVMSANGSGLKELTEGDSLDLAPHWVPGREELLVYQSAGVGRDQNQNPVTYGPFEIHQLDLESGELETLVSDRRFDYLTPQKDSENRLYYIRRPHRDPFHRPWWRGLLDIVLIPWRLVVAIYHFFNFFSMRYSGRPLAKGNSAANQADLKRMMLWGNMIDAEKEIRSKPTEEAPDLVPKDWELVREDPNGETHVLARGVLSFDLAGDGAILYSNGSAVFLMKSPGSTERLLKHSCIEKVMTWN